MPPGLASPCHRLQTEREDTGQEADGQRSPSSARRPRDLGHQVLIREPRARPAAHTAQGCGRGREERLESQALPPAFDPHPPSNLMTWDRNYRHFTDEETEARLSKCAG